VAEARDAAPPSAVRAAAPQSRWDFSHGDQIAPGRSAIRPLGGGYRYEAYLAWDEQLYALVVIKVVRPALVEDGHTLEGLAAEIQMLARLNHPVIVRAFGAELDGPRPHVVLEHLEGPRLSSLIRRYGPLSQEQLVPLAVQVCAAIHYMRSVGVVHLDVKPSNIIMGAPPRLIDLSIARTTEECPDIRSPVGTDAYMAPEQCRPREFFPLGPAADVWGLGVTLYHAVAGERPFSKGNPDSAEPPVRWPQLVEQPAALSGRVPPALAEPIMSCLARDPAARPAPADVAAALEHVLAQLPGPQISKLKPRLGSRRR
jgi:serine/threonine protein kinase